MTVKDIVKQAAYASGLLTAWQRWRTSGRVTVLMFHRVLSPADERWLSADPKYTFSDVAFDACMEFVRRNYDVISLADVLSAGQHNARLPARPLLITFDDGWADNEEYALPVLRTHSLPAAVFVVGGAVDTPGTFWQEAIYGAWARQSLDRATAAALWCPEPVPHVLKEDDLRRRISALTRMSPPERRARLAGVRLPEPTRPLMLSSEQLRHLAACDVAIGCHGETHDPLTRVASIAEELAASRDSIARALECSPATVRAMSFPHGQYSDGVVAAARQAGFEALFSSEGCLNAISPDGRLPTVLGRIEMTAAAACRGGSEVREERLALLLTTRTDMMPRHAEDDAV